jgi:hypothetical protein
VAVPDAGGAPLVVVAPDHLSDGLELAAALDVGFEQGRHRSRRRSRRPRCSDGPTRCHCSGRGRGAAGRLEARRDLVRKIFGREVAVAVCCGKEEGAFSAKLLRGWPGHGFRSVALDAMVQKTPVAPPTTHDLHAASLRQLRGRHVPMTSASLHGPLIAQLMHVVGGPNSFWGPQPFAPSRGRVHGLGSQGLLSVFWIPGYPGPPAPGPHHWPIFSPGKNQRPKLWRRPSRGGAS